MILLWLAVGADCRSWSAWYA